MTDEHEDDIAARYLTHTREGVDFDDPRLADLRARMNEDDITRVHTGLFLDQVHAGGAVDRAKKEYARRGMEAEWHRAWADVQRARGRPEAELTFGNCVTETGVFHSSDGVLTPANLALQRATARVPKSDDLRSYFRALMAALMEELDRGDAAESAK